MDVPRPSQRLLADTSIPSACSYLYVWSRRPPLQTYASTSLTYVALLFIMPGNIINLTPADVLAWPKPNYVDPVRRTWMPFFSGITFAAATLMVATRFWLRIRGHAGRLGLDDVSVTRGANRCD
jgi:hypothetical protein